MLLIKNKKARFDYQILDTFDAGMVLLGNEVKSLKRKTANINSSYIVIKKSPDSGKIEAFLVGAIIPPYQPQNISSNYNPEGERKLLLNKKEILHLLGKLKIKGITLVPLEIYTIRGLIKLKFAIAKGKKKHDKREDIKRRDRERETKTYGF